MKIGNTPDMTAAMRATTSPGLAVAQRAAQATSVSVAKGGAASSLAGVAVTVSSRTREMGRADLGASADVDMEKVNAVRAAIAQGTYKVDAGAIADKMLGGARELLGKSSRA